MSKTQRMVWIDMEMTGLNPEKHVILEIATIVTDENLKILEEGPVIAIKRTDAEMDRIEEWSNKTHSSSGLLERSNSSLTNVQEAEKKTLAFLEKWIKNNFNIGKESNPKKTDNTGIPKALKDTH